MARSMLARVPSACRRCAQLDADVRRSIPAAPAPGMAYKLTCPRVPGRVRHRPQSLVILAFRGSGVG